MQVYELGALQSHKEKMFSHLDDYIFNCLPTGLMYEHAHEVTLSYKVKELYAYTTYHTLLKGYVVNALYFKIWHLTKNIAFCSHI